MFIKISFNKRIMTPKEGKEENDNMRKIKNWIFLNEEEDEKKKVILQMKEN